MLGMLLGSCPAASAGTVVAWGYGTYGALNVPTNLTGVLNVASGSEHCLALQTNGIAVAWGWNYFGQTNVPDLGFNGRDWYPVNGAITNIAAGAWHSLALLQDGTVAAWGDSSGGQTYVPSGLGSVMAVAGGEDNSLALKSDGTIAAWGCHGTCVVPGDLTNIVALDAGQYLSVVLREDGTVTAWGYNQYGECDVPPGLTNVVAVAAGNHHCVALKVDGTVAVWGMTTYGQTNVPDGATNITAIATGDNHTLALRTDGSIVTWGDNSGRQCDVPSTFSNAVAVAGGWLHSLAVASDGTPQFIYGRPGISVLPKKNLLGGDSVLLHASAVGAPPMVYYWRQDGTNIASSTSPNLGLTNLLAAQSGQYSVIASNAQGFAESLPVTLRIDPMIYLTNQPADSTVFEAANAGFSLVAGGYGPLTYQWGFNGVDLPSETNATLALVQVATNQAGTYSVMVSNPYGAFASSNATLTIQLPVITSPPANQTAFGGDGTSFAVSANGAALSYQWLFYGTNLPGATSNVLTLTLLDTNAAGPYAALVSNPYRTLSTTNATLTVVPLTASVAPASQSLFVGDTAAFSAVVEKNGPFTYQWRYNGADIPDQTNATLALTGLTTNQSGSYSVRAANPYGVVESAGAMLFVTDSPPAIVAGPANRFTWIGDTVSFSVVGSGSKPLSYQWSFSGVPLPNRTNASLTLSAVGANQVGTYSVIVTNVLGTASSSATLTLEPVVAWGQASSGQTWVNYPPLTNAVAISAGYNYNLALKSDGTVFSWGGLGTLPATNSNFAAVVAGYSQSLGLRSNGTVVAWGSGTLPVPPANLTNAASIHVAKAPSSFVMNCFAIRSNSTLVGWNNYNNSTLTNIPKGLIGVIGVAAGTSHAMALKSDGSLTAWQDYFDYGANVPPAAISNVNSYTAIAAGFAHSLALRTNGTVVAWGSNGYGQTNVPAGLTNVVAIAAGGYHSLALKSDGTVAVWGQNSYGQLNVPAPYTNLLAISGGGGHTIALNGAADPAIARQPQPTTGLIGQAVLLSVGVVSKQSMSYQWRFNGADIQGATNSWYRIPALRATTIGGYTVAISNAAGVITSAVAQVKMTGNMVVAWGLNTSGQTNVPAGLNALAIGGGDAHSLALRADGTVAAWGTAGYGVTNVPAIATNLIAISAGATHNLVLNASRKVISWGSLNSPPANFTNFLAVSSGSAYSLGLSNGTVAVWGIANPPASLTNAVAISAGYVQALALKPGGTLMNWPSGPSAPPSLTNAVTFASGNGFNLAVQTDGTVTAWGNNSSGQCNVPRGLSNVVAVAAGQTHSLALKSDGTAIAWGGNAYGQTNIPAGLSNVVAIAAGGYHSLAMVGSLDPAIVRQPAPLYTNVTGRLLLSVGAVSSQPLAFQWLTNGTPIPGATNWWLDLPQPLTTQSGSYSVIVSNALGVLTSSDAAVSVLSSPPFFLAQPLSQTNIGGGPLTLSATVGGSPPLAYQWQKDGTAIINATSSALLFSYLTRSNSGVFSVIASNAFGSATSSNAVLRVLMPQTLRPPSPGSDGTIQLLFGDNDGGQLSAADAMGFTVLATTNLVDWDLLTNTLTPINGLLLLQDPAATNFPQRFYRILEQP
jgi:alpha-tubulin suppressor-like RCC1 family protein